jgi:glycosyltransferase involved in cell wall biosynthesis
MKKMALIFFVLICNITQALSTSIVIPCHKKHIKFIPNLLSCYEEQTLKPNEVIVSISEVKSKIVFLEEFLKKNHFSFSVKILINQDKLLAGPNRNRGCSAASNDIIILQDADDLPHPQRVEVISYFFQKYDYDILIHQWGDSEKGFNNTCLDKAFSFDEISHVKTARCYSISEVFAAGHFHFGNIAIRRSLLNAFS